MNTYKVIRTSEVRTEKKRVDGKPSREFVSLFFKSSDPLDINLTVRNIFSKLTPEGNVSWGAYNNGAEFKAAALNATKQGIKHTKTVAEYSIDNRPVTNYSMVVFEGEDVATMFRRAGHPLAETAPAAPAKQAMTADAPVEELNA